MVVVGEALAERRISGVFDVADPDRALSLISTELGVRTMAVPPFVTVLY